MSIPNTPRVALTESTNASPLLSTLQDSLPAKRRVSFACGNRSKRAKVETITQNAQRHIPIHEIFKSKEFTKPGYRNCTAFNALYHARMRPQRNFQHTSLSSRPVLASLVSSNKSDVYKLHSHDDPIVPGLPFACAFTTDAKRGGVPILAVATQEGSIELLNVGKRRDWELEPQRSTIQVHGNAILDVKWGMDDQYLATSSGDSTSRITSVHTRKCVAVLAHHTGSVKSLDWDPNHMDLLSTASRDGSICIWDLRTTIQSNTTEESSALAPVMVIPNAHRDTTSRGRTAKSRSTPKTVTSLLYLPHYAQQLVSSGSFDGVLKQWDLRYPLVGRASKPLMIFESYSDPTRETGSRGRGISNLALGRNHSSNLIWGLATDSSVHTYALPISAPFRDSAPYNNLSHPNMFVNSFYVKLAVSPCGSWLCSGSSGGGVYVWDVASRSSSQTKAVELKSESQEVGAVDWARDFFAACCDNGTIRLWRPDQETSAQCKSNPEEKRWDWVWATED